LGGAISTGSTLLDGGHFEQAVVATSGHMAVMRAPTRASSIRVKEKLAAMRTRDPLTARKGALHAQIVGQLVRDYALGELCLRLLSSTMQTAIQYGERASEYGLLADTIPLNLEKPAFALVFTEQ
jgi:hypothetical protein